jgi:hypothetical protein
MHKINARIPSTIVFKYGKENADVDNGPWTMSSIWSADDCSNKTWTLGMNNKNTVGVLRVKSNNQTVGRCPEK